MKKKKVTNKELNNVNGGAVGDMICTCCHNCGECYTSSTATDRRTVGSGCDEYSEIKCPNCGTWNEEVIN